MQIKPRLNYIQWSQIIKNIEDLHNLSRKVKWQYFEKLVGWIFEQNDFKVKVNFVSKSPKRQYDVIAEKFGNAFLVDCKKWKGGRYKTSQLKSAVEKHIKRCCLLQTENQKIPIIVTLLDEDMTEYNSVPIIPIQKLNAFLNRNI